MITKFLVILAVAFQISAFKYPQESIDYSNIEGPITNSNSRYEYTAATTRDNYPRIIATSGLKSSANSATSNQNQNIGYATPPINVAAAARNLVARGKYPVTLQSCGPAPDKKIPVVTSHLRAPLQEKPTVRLQTKIPAPKTVAHTCTCFKTIIKPRVHQHIITVPSIQRYIETVHRPVIENIHYEGYPIRCLDATNEESLVEKEKNQVETFQPVDMSVTSGRLQLGENSKKNCENFELPSRQTFELPKSQTEKVQVIELPGFKFSQDQESQSIQIPRVQFVSQEQPQEVKIPRIHFVESQKQQTAEVPRVQFIESKSPETFEIPEARFLESKKPQMMELSSAQFLDNKSEAIEVPRVEFLQAQKLHTVEIPRIRLAESPEVQTVEIPRQSGTITLGTSPYTYHFNN